MRFLWASIVAIGIALALFEMMFFLIHSDAQSLETPDVSIAINIQVPAEKLAVQKRPQQQALQEPIIQQTTVEASASTIALPELALKSPLITTDLTIELSENDLGRYQHNWVQPTGTSNVGSAAQDYIAERDAGTKEMVPIATRQPLIPKVAWDNKINGWVLVAFAVNNNGLVEDIRIMDASPRGVFEAHAVSAVEKWRYDAYQGPKKYLSQRIEFLYKNYPNNWGDF